MAVSKRLTREDLMNLYPAPSEAFTRRTAEMLRRLPERRRESPLRGKLLVSIALALALMLTAFGALAAALDWNVMDFLFGGRELAAQALVQDVSACSTDGQVILRVNTAMTDGTHFAMDWTIQNERPDEPVYLKLEAYTANGAALCPDGNDSFDDSWLPGPYGEAGVKRGGEILDLPEAVRSADTLDMVLTVGIYHPKQPVAFMDRYDPERIAEKMAAGYLVAPEGEGLALMEDSVMIWAAGLGQAALAEHFTRTEVTAAFTLNLRSARDSVKPLAAEERYRSGRLTVSHVRATVSLMGLSVEMDIEGADMEDQFLLTDDRGNVLEDSPGAYGFMEPRKTADGSEVYHLSYTWYGMIEDKLPDVISLTCFPEEGDPVLIPLRVR